MKNYQPIDCNLYDYIEHFATLRQVVRINYESVHGTSIVLLARITDTHTTTQKEEFLLLDNGSSIRLDRLIQLDQILFNFGTC